MTTDQARAWMTHPDILELRRFIGDIFQREEHTAARTWAELTVGIHHGRHPDDVTAEYHRAIIAARGRLEHALQREEIR